MCKDESPDFDRCPALEALIEAFPFEIKGFHADNGSEYINYRVARLLRKRRHLGHAHIARRHAALVNGFLRDVLAPYLNYHRPCHFPVETTDSKGRTRKSYPFENVTTPYLKLKSLECAQRSLRPGVTFEQLDSVAVALDDLAAARLVNAPATNCFATSSAVRPRRHERIVHRAESTGSQPHDKGRILWICGRVLRTGASPAGRVDTPVDNAPALPTLSRLSPTSSTGPTTGDSQRTTPHNPSPRLPPPTVSRQHSAPHSNRSQYRPRAGSPPTLQAHFRMGLD